jgi:hypothetical protein
MVNNVITRTPQGFAQAHKTPKAPVKKTKDSSIMATDITLPTNMPLLAPGGIGSLNIGDGVGDGVLIKFDNIHVVSGFAPDMYGKEKAVINISPEIEQALEKFCNGLKEHFGQVWPDYEFTVKNPYYNGQVRLGWPMQHKRGEKTPLEINCYGISDNDFDVCSMGQFNELVATNVPKDIYGYMRLWVRREKEDNVYTAGAYFTIDAAHF